MARLSDNRRSIDDRFAFDAFRARFSFRIKFPQDQTVGSHCCPSQINKFVLVLAFSATSAEIVLRREQPRPAAGCRPLEKVGQREFTMYTCPLSIFSRSYFLSCIISVSLSISPFLSPLRRIIPSVLSTVLYRSPFHALSLHPSLSSLSCNSFTLHLFV